MTNRFIKETAKAWGIPQKKVKRLSQWVNDKVPTYKQSAVFTILLRRERKHSSNTHN